MKKQYVSNPQTITFNSIEYPVAKNYNEALEHLQQGQMVAMYEGGNSMYPILCDMEYGLMIPTKEVEVGDAVFCRLPVSQEAKAMGWDGLMTHYVAKKVKISGEDPYYLISSTSGDVYGWTQEIYAKVLTTRIFELTN